MHRAHPEPAVTVSDLVVGDSPAPGAAPVDLDRLYHEHWHRLVRMAALLLDDAAAAEDAVQEAFVSLHRNRSVLRDPDAAVGYVRTAVVNRTRSDIRRRQVARRHLSALHDVPVPGADEPVMLAEEHQRTYDAVRALPRRQREVLILRYWLRLSETEIAAALSISVGTVKSSASRGIAALKQTLGDSR